MQEAPDLTVVLPVYNEAENIGPVLHGFASQVCTPHEVLVVYDFDEDSTVPVVLGLMGEMPNVRLYRNTLGRGVLNALRSGLAEARAAYILVSMADGSDDPGQVDEMVRLAREGADVVAASRYMPGGRQIGGPRVKRLLSRFAGLTLHWFGGLPIHDPTSNFKLYSRRFLDSVSIESQGGFELALELSVKAALRGYRMTEVPTTWRDRTAGQSRFRFRAWVPRYLRWYAYYYRGRLSQALAALDRLKRS